MAILITGGAGYVGSHTVIEMLARGEEVVVLDSLELGHREACDGVVFYCGDLRDDSLLGKVFLENDIEAVMHFAAYSAVGESVVNPVRYYNNNVISSIKLLNKVVETGVKMLVFSSTAAVYGDPERLPIDENHLTAPTNPYGDTKLAVERAILWAEKAYGLRHIILRYFNAAGAHQSGKIGEDHHPETHLIPIILRVALGKAERVNIFGSDYPTPDGTCIRDYIHVSDLATAHILGLERLRRKKESGLYNLGNGKGFSNLEVLEAARKVTGRKVEASFSERRAGDPPVLVASSGKASRDLGWRPSIERLEDIIETAWRWHSLHPDGFGK